MRFIITFCFLLIPVLHFSQEKPQTTINTYLLEVGEYLYFGNKSISFKEVITDSRCPKDVSCVWAGVAIISVEVYEDGKFIEEKIIPVASSGIPLKFSAENIIYNIAGLSLSPIPSVKKQTLPEEYRLELRLRETIQI